VVGDALTPTFAGVGGARPEAWGERWGK